MTFDHLAYLESVVILAYQVCKEVRVLMEWRVTKDTQEAQDSLEFLEWRGWEDLKVSQALMDLMVLQDSLELLASLELKDTGAILVTFQK